MTREDLDEIDRRILAMLQEDARRTAREIGDEVGVSDTTVLNRIERLEDAGVILDYRAVIDYERAGYQRPFLLTCTVSLVEREDVAHRALSIPGVVRVLERMTGRENLLVEAVGATPDDVTRIAEALTELGADIGDESLVRAVHHSTLRQRSGSTETPRR